GEGRWDWVGVWGVRVIGFWSFTGEEGIQCTVTYFNMVDGGDQPIIVWACTKTHKSKLLAFSVALRGDVHVNDFTKSCKDVVKFNSCPLKRKVFNIDVDDVLVVNDVLNPFAAPFGELLRFRRVCRLDWGRVLFFFLGGEDGGSVEGWPRVCGGKWEDGLRV
ncbi:hypothetical protein Tsubulata_011475, partial [Turnera subulata]